MAVADLSDYTTRTPRPIAIRDELLVQVQSLEASERKLKRYERLRDRLLGRQTEADYLATSERGGSLPHPRAGHRV